MYNAVRERVNRFIINIMVINPRSVATLPAIKADSHRNTRDSLAWTAGFGDPMPGVCIPHRIPRAWEQQG